MVTLQSVARGVALFFGVLGLVGVAVSVCRPGVDLNRWWMDLRPLPTILASGILAVAAGLFVAFAVMPPEPGWRLALTRAFALALGSAALVNAAGFLLLVLRGRIETSMPVPLSLAIAVALAVIAWGTFRPVETGVRPLLVGAGVAALCALAFPALQVACFGSTNYRRKADAIVVFGARAHADGTLSQALRDRMHAAVVLWNQGYAPTLILSGGPGDGEVHETEAMRRWAVSQGVPNSAILVDSGGVSTEATARNCATLLHALNAHRVLAVSHFYHTPRVKLAFQARGLDVLTVPSPQERPLIRMPWFVAREVAAWWVYTGRVAVGAL